MVELDSLDDLGSVTTRILYGILRDESTLQELQECIIRLIWLQDEAAKLRLLFNLKTLLSSPSRKFLECIMLALKRFGCAVVTNEYEFHEMVQRCTYRSTLFTVDIVGIQETIPGFYQATIRACDRYFRILGTDQFESRIIPSPVVSNVDVVELSRDEDPREEGCIVQRYLFIVTQAGKYTIRYILEYRSRDKGPEGRLVLPVSHIVGFHSPRPPERYYRVKGYGFRREIVVHRSELEPVDFGDVYPASYGLDLPSTWWCRRLYTDDSMLDQYACLRLDLGLAALVYMPSEAVGAEEVSREEWDDLWSELVQFKYIEQPLGFSLSKRALFFAPPAYGTFNVYSDRLSEVDEETVETIKTWLDDAVKAYHKDTGRSHEALYPWNIYIDSVGLRIGPPRSFLNKLLGTSIPPLDDSKAEKKIINRILGKARLANYNSPIALTEEEQEDYPSRSTYTIDRIILSRIKPLIEMLDESEEDEE